jgi:hypothetical protein
MNHNFLHLVSTIKAKWNCIYVIAFFTFALQIPNFYGEDIVNARNNYLSGSKTDFWGGISTLIYSHVPNYGLRWQIWLALIQITLASIGLYKIFFTKNFRKKSRLFAYITIYSALLFASQMTRDGLLFSLLVLGYGLFQEAVAKNAKKYLVFSIFVVSFGLSFRPWISVAMIPILLFAFKTNQKKAPKIISLFIGLVILVAPYLIDFAASSALNLNRSYPQQQVILMDAAAGYCYSNNSSTGHQAKEILSNFSSDPRFDRYVCQMYRPDTWESLIKSNSVSSAGFDPHFKLIKPGHESQYQRLSKNWMHMVLSDPISYVQNRILFIGKLSIGSDMRRISLLTATTFNEKIVSLYKLPYEIALSLHLYSFLSVITFLLLNSLKIFRTDRGNIYMELNINSFSLSFLFSLLMWLLASSVAYIGSNGRYMYSITLLTIIAYIASNNNLAKTGHLDGE